ncbi:GNAT family N-acetyltransferase [Sabulicella glaciei]|uniref:GNAT family N-acetyltransferase n=1 Tax=Sabulicella glaciei TaxID=2984948 RepID=A0ABT3NVC6_9PROT|nr:GNAT family protein [Roseococcus sp. MDT2-1-1]MCW8086099.1 GNAT family N-acetyltransferase [Roseococcus sp. MDT2-1-1]
MSPSFTLRRLGASDALTYRDLRLLGLRSHPEAFGASFEDEAGRTVEWFAERLDLNVVWGGWRDGDPDLAGVAALHVSGAAKARHKGVLWGMFVRSEVCGSGLAAALAERVLAHAKDVVEEVRLSVVASNVAAVRLYTQLGFRPYGVEPRALKVGGEYHDEVLMALRF